MYLITGQPGFSVVPFTWIERFLCAKRKKTLPQARRAGRDARQAMDEAALNGWTVGAARFVNECAGQIGPMRIYISQRWAEVDKVAERRAKIAGSIS